MKAIRVHKFGGPEVLQLDDVADPKAGPGQVLVEIKAAGVNPVDTYVRSGNYAILPQLPYVPGADGAGWIANTPWGSFYSYGAGGRVGSFTLLNTPGFTLPDYSLPTQLDIADWSTEHELDMSYVFHTIGPNGTTIDGGSIFLRAILTSITVAPEPGTMAILGLGFAGCVLFRRRRQRGLAAAREETFERADNYQPGKR